ncbi:Transcriptional regulatory protein CreB [Serratia ficaria]|nr:Transcriptional regulatory protein CreB [Serratia ficaria]
MKPLLWLVEDEPSIADTLIYTLESEGFQVRWFERGEPALQALAQGGTGAGDPRRRLAGHQRIRTVPPPAGSSGGVAGAVPDRPQR